MTTNNYAELKKKYFCEDVMSEKQDNNSDELLIKSNVQNPILKELLNRIEREYGCLITNTGCTVKNDSGDIKWLSVKSITVLISEFDNELKGDREI